MAKIMTPEEISKRIKTLDALDAEQLSKQLEIISDQFKFQEELLFSQSLSNINKLRKWYSENINGADSDLIFIRWVEETIMSAAEGNSRWVY